MGDVCQLIIGILGILFCITVIDLIIVLVVLYLNRNDGVYNDADDDWEDNY